MLKYRQRLLDHLQHRTYTPRKIAQLAEDLGIGDVEEFERAVHELADEGVLEITEAGLVMLPSVGEAREIEGTFRRHPKGFGFVQTDDPRAEGDLFVPAGLAGDALTGDRVRVRVLRQRRRTGTPQPGRSPYFGQVIEILSRKRAQFTGELRRQGGQWLVFPDGTELRDPVIVRDPQAKNAREGDKVVIELLEYPRHTGSGAMLLGEGVITRVLGAAGEPDIETQAVIAAYGLRTEFPQACLEQARAVARQFEEELHTLREVGRDERGRSLLVAGGAADRLAEARIDLREEFVVTIDPPDARDYDDAISIRRTSDGWELGVHIADVGHFIPAGSPLDEEARQRGNSVYLPRLVIPMLPEILSNGICSLQEGVPRYCRSAFIRYDARGQVQAEGVGATLIRSAKRLTYLEAQALIDGNLDEARRHARTEPAYSETLLTILREMDTLARRIEERRHQQGMITLELPEVVLIFDEQGRVVDAEREDDAYTHRIIEMFMVEANEVLARLFENLNVPLMRRVHPEPAPGDVEELRRAAKVAGYTIPARPSREELQMLLDATRGTPAARAVHMAVLRTLTRAAYSPALIGHFALASEAYAHFTSPIRRYADLLVHRALGEYLALTAGGRNRPRTEAEREHLGRRLRDRLPDERTLVEIGHHITRTEENAEEAEHQLRTFLVLQLLEQHVGQAYRGVVTGVGPRGVFVQLDKFLVDGLIAMADLPGDVTRGGGPPAYRVDPRSGALVDQRSGRSFNVGDLVTVRIARVDPSRRQLDLVLDDPASRAPGKARKIVPTADAGGLTRAAPLRPPTFETGAQRRARRSKARERSKRQWRRDTP